MTYQYSRELLPFNSREILIFLGSSLRFRKGVFDFFVTFRLSCVSCCLLATCNRNGRNSAHKDGLPPSCIPALTGLRYRIDLYVADRPRQVIGASLVGNLKGNLCHDTQTKQRNERKMVSYRSMDSKRQ